MLIEIQLPCFIIMAQFILIIGIHGMEPIKNETISLRGYACLNGTD